MSQIDLGQISFRPRGDYDANTTYNRLDAVSYAGETWIAMQDGLLGQTPQRDTNWMCALGSVSQQTYIKVYDKTEADYWVWFDYDANYFRGSGASVKYDTATKEITVVDTGNQHAPSTTKYWLSSRKAYCQIVNAGIGPKGTGLLSVPAYVYAEFNDAGNMIRHRPSYNGAKYQKYENNETHVFTGKESGSDIIWTPDVSGKGTSWTDSNGVNRLYKDEYTDDIDHHMEVPPAGSIIIDQ